MKRKTFNGQAEGILNSMDGAAKAVPNDALFRLIEQRVSIPFSKGRTVSLGTLSAAAASVAVLIMLNLALLSEKQDAMPSGDARAVVEYYGILDNGEMGGI